jgi:NAD(P)-dependent dehydrogenase (short-subunit alcohol dehydrogenase family)
MDPNNTTTSKKEVKEKMKAFENKEIKQDFINARILVTGASSGIGRSCALYFLNSGARVALVGRDVESLKSIAEKFPNQAIILKCDLSIDIQVFDLKTTVVQVMGGIDIIVNCAGVMFDGDVEKTFPQDFDYMVDTNLRSVYIIMTSFYEFMYDGACIVNVSCLAGSLPQQGSISYSMSKAGLELLTKYAAVEYAEKGIRVNAVSSCLVDTNYLRFVGISDNEVSNYRQRVSKNIPIGRMATPDDVVKAIIYLASKKSSHMTGHILKVDGGKSLTSSGYVPWKGQRKMNSRFEPDDLSIKNKVGGFWSLVWPKKEEHKNDTEKPDIDALMKESNFNKVEFWDKEITELKGKI